MLFIDIILNIPIVRERIVDHGFAYDLGFKAREFVYCSPYTFRIMRPDEIYDYFDKHSELKEELDAKIV